MADSFFIYAEILCCCFYIIDDEVMRKAIQLLMIHNAVLIECPQYSGPRLDKVK